MGAADSTAAELLICPYHDYIADLQHKDPSSCLTFKSHAVLQLPAGLVRWWCFACLLLWITEPALAAEPGLPFQGYSAFLCITLITTTTTVLRVSKPAHKSIQSLKVGQNYDSLKLLAASCCSSLFADLAHDYSSCEHGQAGLFAIIHHDRGCYA